ncbi:MAG: TrmH family RNA methyltransferase [Acidimicrobiia bacterium]
MTSFEVTSTANPRIKRLIRLREDRRFRHRKGLFIIEGPRLLARAIEAGFEPEEVYWDGSTPIPWNGPSILVEPSVLDRASYRRKSEGVIAVLPQFPTGLDSLPPSPTFLLGAENLEKPGNLGAMLRTADAVGAEGFVVVGAGVDPFNPNAIRASTGALLTVPLALCTLEELVGWLSDRDIELIAATPDADKTVWEVDLTRPCLLLVGAEDQGLTAAARTAARALVSVPMAGSVDSLNASVTLAVMAYEAARQRSLLNP